MGNYLRYAALGDSATVGLGDPVPTGWRGWARLLAEALGTTYDVSFCNTASIGGTAAVVVESQLADAVAHRPDLASLIVGLNDLMRSGWDPVRLRQDVMTCAEALSGEGALLMTPRFHDHSLLWPLPGWMRRSLQRRTGDLNAVWDEAYKTYGGLRIDFGAVPDVYERMYWSTDRLHPSELGHRRLARELGEQLVTYGLTFEPPSLEPAGGLPTTWRQDLAWMAGEGVPWMGRRARDLVPWVVRRAWARPARPERTPVA
ncbi:Lysophospholipase L1 [Nocardioides sp. YR527]|uniref:SGNH/GDSL hydrolase family protein n=1 Tax=Nocardioides sp. YR527 TaxID=1881028 RepID=UPI00088D2867|nr:SGNH/GDSL hydrolase family protein [Nocardioides sp. YR527]SDK80906.1 Lysophospholipase L1 [Nocardioides sp. YR527]